MSWSLGVRFVPRLSPVITCHTKIIASDGPDSRVVIKLTSRAVKSKQHIRGSKWNSSALRLSDLPVSEATRGFEAGSGNIAKMHFHAKSESEVTSMGASSSSTPRRPLYFVQSPTSRDSLPDGDKTPFSFTPLGSPSHRSVSASLSGRHSRTSSGTHFWSKVIPDESHSRTKWPQANAIAEEAFRDDESGGRKIWPRRSHVLLFVSCFALLFTIFCLALWGASRPYKPQITLKSIVFSHFHVDEGADGTGVPTIMMSANSTLKLSVYNPAKFFGIHVVSTPVNLLYSELSVATGQLEEYYQSRKSHNVVSIVVEGEKVPLYGAGGNLSSSNENGDIPLDLVFSIQSKAYVLGNLVKQKFRRHIHCKIVLDSNKLKVIGSLQKVCQYD